MTVIVFWILAAIALYVYFGYPLLLAILARGAHRDIADEIEFWPSVTMLISAFNEEDCIAEKLENSLELEYPADQLEIIVISHASIDQTDEIVVGFEQRGVILLRMEERGGKTLGLNAGVKQSGGDVIVFSDANAMYDKNALKMLVRNFASPTVGAAIGESRYYEQDWRETGSNESLYWRYETFIKKLESALGSVVGGDGAIYAIKKRLYSPMAAGDISDYVNPLQIVGQGYRCIYEPNAFSYEHAANSLQKEYKRKVRIVNRAWRATVKLRRLLNPFKFGFFSIQLISHKLLRWVMMPILLAIFVLNIYLLSQGLIYVLLIAFQLIFYLAALAGYFSRDRSNIHPILSVPMYFILVNMAGLQGIIEATMGRRYVTWATSRSEQ